MHQKRGYEVIEHTADVGLRIYGRSLDAVFAVAAEALMACVVENVSELRPSESAQVSVEADSLEELLVDWLSELLFRFDARHEIHAWPKVHVSGAALSGVSHFLPVDWQRHRFTSEVKAVTYHGAKVERTPDGWCAEVILDL